MKKEKRKLQIPFAVRSNRLPQGHLARLSFRFRLDAVFYKSRILHAPEKLPLPMEDLGAAEMDRTRPHAIQSTLKKNGRRISIPSC